MGSKNPVILLLNFVKILQPSVGVIRYLKKRNLLSKYEKQVSLLSKNIRHPSLHTERLEPKEAGLYSFRIDKQYRGIFFFIPGEEAIKIIEVNDHYRR